MDNIFEQATRKKLRFALNGGVETVSTEELWELKLTDLDKIAQATNKKLKDESGEESFIGKKKRTNSSLSLKLDVLKSVISTKLEEEEKAKSKAANRAQIELLEELLQKKQLSKLENSSITSIEKQLAALKSGDESEE